MHRPATTDRQARAGIPLSVYFTSVVIFTAAIFVVAVLVASLGVNDPGLQVAIGFVSVLAALIIVPAIDRH